MVDGVSRQEPARAVSGLEYGRGAYGAALWFPAILYLYGMADVFM